MTRTLPILTALLLLLTGANLAEAKYRMPPAHEIYGQSDLIVLGKVLEVREGSYSVEVEQQLLGPQKAVKGTIEVVRRPPTRLCKPQDPSGIVAGTRWVWILRGKERAKPYRSWISTPLRTHKDAKGALRVGAFHILPGQSSRQDLRSPDPTLEVFTQVVRGYRRCVQVSRGKTTIKVKAKELEAYVASSPYAAELYRRTPKPESSK